MGGAFTPRSSRCLAFKATYQNLCSSHTEQLISHLANLVTCSCSHFILHITSPAQASPFTARLNMDLKVTRGALNYRSLPPDIHSLSHVPMYPSTPYALLEDTQQAGLLTQGSLWASQKWGAYLFSEPFQQMISKC